MRKTLNDKLSDSDNLLCWILKILNDVNNKHDLEWIVPDIKKRIKEHLGIEDEPKRYY